MYFSGDLYYKALSLEFLDFNEAIRLYEEAPLEELMAVADAVKRRLKNDGTVTWQIDRNVNITNVCVSGCKFCNFHCRPAERDKAYVTGSDQYREKIAEMVRLGGDQLLLQGGLHPRLGIEYYEELFRSLKQEFPAVRLHALGPPEVAHLSRISGISSQEALDRLVAAGLDSLAGAGAEILDNEVRRRISPGKCSADRWLEIMGEAHRMGLATSATMMYGHVEQPRHRIEHLLKIRDLQARKPKGAPGFLAFIPWAYQGEGTVLEREGCPGGSSTAGYLRLIAVSRLVLVNVPNIQASWLTMGVPAAQMALHGGANDMGSIMIEENVVSSAGSHNSLDAAGMQRVIREAGFVPRLRDQLYRFRDQEPVI